MTLYNLRSADGDYRITKFTNDLEVESSYLTSLTECQCPAGSRPTCRHRQMLPKMLDRDIADSPMFYDFEGDYFVEPLVSEANGSSDNDTEIELKLEDEGETELDRNMLDTDMTPHSVADSTTDFDSVSTGSNPVEAAKPHPSIGPLKRRV